MTLQSESTQIIKKIDHWVEFLSLMRQLAQEEASAECDDEFESDTILELINKVAAAVDEDDTIQQTTFRFEYRDGREVNFGLTCDFGAEEEAE